MTSLNSIWKRREKTSHKGQNGKVLVIGGSKEYTGSLVLVGLAAYRAGADIVTIAAPEKVAWAINCGYPDLITRKFKGDYFDKKHLKEILELSKNFDVVVIGNGLGRKSDIFVKEFLNKVNKKCVVDADAIKAGPVLKNAVLTPHTKEFEIYSGKKLSGELKTDIEIVKASAKENIILLKGNIDIIATKDKYYLNKFGNPGMTKAGTGDVLAGICAGLIAQKIDDFDAACLAAYLNGRAGDRARKEFGYGFLASDLLNKIY